MAWQEARHALQQRLEDFQTLLVSKKQSNQPLVQAFIA